MEVHVTNVPVQTGEHDLRKFLKPKIDTLGIRAFHCHTARGKDFAKLTFRTEADGQRFLLRYGEIRPNQRQRPPPTYVPKLVFHSKPIYCGKSKWEASEFLLRCLERDEKKLVENSTQYGPPSACTSFDCTSLMCGTLGYANDDFAFMPEIMWRKNGIVHFKERSMIVILDDGLRMVIRYDTIVLVTMDGGHYPGITVLLYQAPHFFKDPPKNDPLSNITDNFGNINLNGLKSISPSKRCRVPGFDDNHRRIASTCLAYRCILAHAFSPEVEKKLGQLKHARGVPSMIYHSTPAITARESHADGLRKLHEALTSLNNTLPFPLTFQVQRLAQNAFLSPRRVLDLLPTFKSMFERSPLSVCVAAIKRLAYKLPYPGPSVEADAFGKEAITELLRESEKISSQEALYAEGFGGTASKNTALIHRVTITPTGIYLDGPDTESNNRVLRKYAGNHDSFVRVSFGDEDGNRIQYASNISNDKIFDGVFKNVLMDGFTIANQKYEYLGSSHSSLRSQSCWFVAPFSNSKGYHDAKYIIHDLGDFTAIRSPAKCAARIGQAFSDTPNAITLDSSVVVGKIPDIERNGRVFSDGVGTMSESLMYKIWENLPNKNLVKPTCFQIRYQGAKGMISLDTRLPGYCLRLRDSMIKFGGSLSNDLEICGGAYKPLPMYLNRQFIKILEDLGVKPEYFMKLQRKEVSRLRAITANPINASTFLYRKKVGDVALLSYLTEHCSSLGLDFRNDKFLRDVLEMAVFMELRTLKHKARIPFEDGYHLHGLMDETGILKEGEVYCCWLKDGKRTTLVAPKVVITRAPALHPGDVQLVNAVDVPSDSPLKKLYNCICFSQKGARDLPSQLSGGDLDGDLYYVMFDEELKLKRTETPADYPRLPPLDIGRIVTQKDMAEFFLTFMKTDQLGVIANRHQVYADQSEWGTRSSQCLKLAELHSTAVDFSKTGIPADVNGADVPRSTLWRPDFMASGPHIKISNQPKDSIELAKEYAPIEVMDEEDEISNIKYYESPKACGQLYRDIDERQFFDEIKRINSQADDDIDIMQKVWEFVLYQCKNLFWHHWRDDALQIQEIYENSIQNIMHDYSEHPNRPISEREVFVGDVLGKVGAVSKKQRELCTSMKEKYDEDTTFVINCIIKDKDGYAEEALERSIACFAVSLEKRKPKASRDEALESFKYLAAGVCLREMERVPGLLNNW
ncbi:hypothetical protein DSL72_005419 [Monilinia vaccinii-corymbosi]|uniref:RNA-dependent RNA polymerase n=1 Tax=Monilinia vaccinii-corymbosi TaxID=61207 RepID=A0A8A3PFP1_9HELO|nr:hypothetical protein DSL72_005419 [Monilinia vaccinii-corymbosi]